MPTQPLNLIIITSDEMRADAPGFMGNPDCRTPNLDRFAEKGVVFENHFAVHGKCVPSRISMVTGRYVHTDGFRTINLHLPDGEPNLLESLKKNGYETAVFGLNHVWEKLYGQNEKGSGCADYHSFTKGYFDDLLKREWPVPESGPNAVQPPELPREQFHYNGRIEEPLTYFCDDNRTEQAIHYLSKVRDRARPFFMQLNISRPHPPYAVEEPYFSMYDRKAIRAWPHEVPDGAPLPTRKMREIRTGVETGADAFREIQAVYYGMITKVDVLLGRVFEAIEREGLLENSVVLFTTDHGDFAGQYGLVEKWDTCMADCILRSPLILRAPGLPNGTRVKGLNEKVDLPPTLLELLGIEPDWGIHGRSLLPLIRGGPGKEAVFADGGHEEEMWGRFNFNPQDKQGNPRPLDGKQRTYREAPETMARTKMVRTERWKLVCRLAGGNELYDLQADPQELKNLWGAHASDAERSRVVRDLQEKLIEWCLRTDTDRPFEPKVGA
jgi:choline-sulfatase